jgi:hypothetical protein
MTERYLEDYAVGQTFASGRMRVDKERIKAFAAEFDPQPFHLDDAQAAGTIFRGLAASGWHTAALTKSVILTLKSIFLAQSACGTLADNSIQEQEHGQQGATRQPREAQTEERQAKARAPRLVVLWRGPRSPRPVRRAPAEKA